MMQFSQRKKSDLHNVAKSLRQSGSIVEKLLRKYLCEQSKAFGLKFRYQHPLDRYVVDFVCLQAKLVIEIDGFSHDVNTAKDFERTCHIEKQGFSILRFTNAEVRKNPEAVAIAICEEAKKLQSEYLKKAPPRKVLFT